jgi:hypothetical protein
MTVLVTKANSDYWYRIRVLNTMEDLQRFIKECHHDVIVETNSYTKDYNFDFWDGMKAEDIPVIKNCPLHLTIYNDYVE